MKINRATSEISAENKENINDSSKTTVAFLQ